MRRWSIALVVLLGMAGAGVIAVAPGASAAKTTCLVVDTNSDHSYTSLQDAVTAAAPGDTLFVKGTCTGTTEISKNLTVTGQSNGGTKTATLNGGGQGSVLIIDDVTVTLNKLIITGGSNATQGGGGILNNNGTVTLNDVSITRNTAPNSSGGGIGNTGTGTVTLNGTSSISGNTAGFDGGGIANFANGGTVTLNGSSSITGNTAGIDGGGIDNNIGTVTLNDSSSITGNKPDNCAPPGSVPGCTG